MIYLRYSTYLPVRRPAELHRTEIETLLRQPIGLGLPEHSAKARVELSADPPVSSAQYAGRIVGNALLTLWTNLLRAAATCIARRGSYSCAVPAADIDTIFCENLVSRALALVVGVGFMSTLLSRRAHASSSRSCTGPFW